VGYLPAGPALDRSRLLRSHNRLQYQIRVNRWELGRLRRRAGRTGEAASPTTSLPIHPDSV
jgi:hypothetical protein